MAISLPTRGQRDWDDELNNALNQMDASAEDAKSKANAAVSTANNALNVAQSVQNAVVGGADAATAGFVDDDDSATNAAVAKFVGYLRGKPGDHVDWAVAINAAFASGVVDLRLRPDLGDLPIRSTIYVPAGATFRGAPGTRLVLANGYDLDSLTHPRWNAQPIVTNAVPTSGTTDGVHLYDLTIVGNSTQNVSDDIQYGILFLNATNCSATNCTVEDINYAAYPAVGVGAVPGIGIGSANATGIRWENCSASGAGYENFGAMDNSHEVDWINCYAGPAWRTSFQIHRNCTDLRVNGLTIRQNDPRAHSALTIHSIFNELIERVALTNIDIESYVDTTQTDRGGIQLEDYGAQGLVATNVRIVTNNYGVYLSPGANDVEFRGLAVKCDHPSGNPVRAVMVESDNVKLSSVTLESDAYGLNITTNASGVRVDGLTVTSDDQCLRITGTDVEVRNVNLTRPTGSTTTPSKVIVVESNATDVRVQGGSARFTGTTGLVDALVLSASAATRVHFEDLELATTGTGNLTFFSSIGGHLILRRLRARITTAARGINIDNEAGGLTQITRLRIEDCDMTSTSAGTMIRVVGNVTNGIIRGNRTAGTGVGLLFNAPVSNCIAANNMLRESTTPLTQAGTGMTYVDNVTT